MLKSMRKNTKIIIWTVIISFALWGGFSVGVQFQKQGRFAGEIFGKPVTFQEYDRFYKSARIFSFGGDSAEKDENRVRQETWESLIFSREAKRTRVQVSDEEVRAEIIRLLALQKIENPTPEIYERWLRATIRETPQEFESQIRELLRIQKLLKNVQAGGDSKPVTEEAARDMYNREQTQIGADTVSFKTKDEADQFLSAVKTPADWDKTVKEKKLTVTPSGLLTAATWVELRGFPEKDGNLLLDAQKDGFLGPFQQGEDFVVMKITDKQTGSEEDFQKSYKEKYMEQLKNQNNYEAFLVWQQELMARAKPKDYMPKAPAENVLTGGGKAGK